MPSSLSSEIPCPLVAHKKTPPTEEVSRGRESQRPYLSGR